MSPPHDESSWAAQAGHVLQPARQASKEILAIAKEVTALCQSICLANGGYLMPKREFNDVQAVLVGKRVRQIAAEVVTLSNIPPCALTRLMHWSKQHRYSMTSSARKRSDCGMVSPIAFAVLRLITSSNFVGCSTGKSSGFAPWKILCTSAALRRKMSGVYAP